MSEEQTIPDPQTTQTEGLPEGFTSVAQLTESYTALRSKMSAEGAPKQEVSAPVAEAPPSIQGLIEQATSEATATGAVSEATIIEMEKLGVSPSFVSEVVEARKMKSDGFTKGLIEAAGGQQEWDQLKNWASTTLTPDQRSAFNDAINSGNPESAKFAIAGLKSQFSEDIGSSRRGMLLNDGTASGALQGYANEQDVLNDMKNPEYKTSESFRQTVDARLRVSPNIKF